MHVTILASYQILFLYTECYRLEFYFSVINMQIWEKKFKCNSYVKNDLNMGDRRKWEREWFGSICFNQRARLNMWFMNIFDIIYTNCMVDFSNGIWKHLWNRVCILRWKISIVKNLKKSTKILYTQLLISN